MPAGVLGGLSLLFALINNRWSTARFNPAVQTAALQVKSWRTWTDGGREEWGAALVPFAKAPPVTCHLLSRLHSPLKRNKGECRESLCSGEIRWAFISHFISGREEKKKKLLFHRQAHNAECDICPPPPTSHLEHRTHSLAIRLGSWLYSSDYCFYQCATS